MKLDAQLKRATMINKMLKKQRVELRKIGRAQDARKKNLDKLTKTTPDVQQPLFIQSLPLGAPTQQPPPHDTQSSIAIPLMHSIEGGTGSLEYSVSTMMHEGMDSINM